ncbi:50S ribosomal protein L3 [Patescibacteria group bacterium]
MIKTLFGTKLRSTRVYNQRGEEVPITEVAINPMRVVQIKTKEKDGYDSLQLGIGFGREKNINKPEKGHLKGAKLKKPPFYLKEVRLEEKGSYHPGQEILTNQVLVAGDLVSVSGVSKGKGFTGVVKRWGFAGGPKTHGQSDRERAPGSIGQTTTIGRVFKGKKMAGRSGGKRTTIKNLCVLSIDEKRGVLKIKGLLPGITSGKLEIAKTGNLANFIPLLGPDEALKAENLGVSEKKEKGEKKENG